MNRTRARRRLLEMTRYQARCQRLAGVHRLDPELSNHPELWARVRLYPRVVLDWRASPRLRTVERWLARHWPDVALTDWQFTVLRQFWEARWSRMAGWGFSQKREARGHSSGLVIYDEMSRT